MPTKVWTWQEVRDDLNAMVTEMGRQRYVYHPAFNHPCDYVRDRAGEGEGHGCIVGEWVRRQGADMMVLDQWQQGEWGNDDSPPPDAHGMWAANGAPPEETLLPTLTRHAVKYLGRVQSQQDQGTPWGAAIDQATEYAEHNGWPE